MDRSGRVESGLSGLSGRVCISAAGARPRVRPDLLLPAGHPRLLGQQQRPARRPAFLGRGWHSSEPPAEAEMAAAAPAHAWHRFTITQPWKLGARYCKHSAETISWMPCDSVLFVSFSAGSVT